MCTLVLESARGVPTSLINVPAETVLALKKTAGTDQCARLCATVLTVLERQLNGLASIYSKIGDMFMPIYPGADCKSLAPVATCWFGIRNMDTLSFKKISIIIIKVFGRRYKSGVTESQSCSSLVETQEPLLPHLTVQQNKNNCEAMSLYLAPCLQLVSLGCLIQEVSSHTGGAKYAFPYSFVSFF